MKRAAKMMTIVFLTILLTTAAGWAGEPQNKVQGEVVRIQQMQQTQNHAELQQLTIRTRQGEVIQLHLGQAGQCADCVQMGDQIRARVMYGSNGQAERIQSMKVCRNGEMYVYENQAGQLVQTRQRLRDGSGGGQQVRGREQGGVHDSDSAKGRGGAGGGGRGNGGTGGGKR